MDLTNQNKFKNILIVVLLVINVLTVSIIWIQAVKGEKELPKRRDNKSSESVQLLKKTLELDEEQTKQLEKLRVEPMEQSKQYNDRLGELKKQLAEELFNEKPDTVAANRKAREIGELQSKIEMIRFNYFNRLVTICTPEQKAKLKPIVSELFSKKPPKEEPIIKDKPAPRKEELKREEEKSLKDERTNPPIANEERPEPPSIEEKLLRYTERLNLSPEQEEKVQEILAVSRDKGEKLRNRINPDPNKIELEKEKIRKEEDESIKKILGEEQNIEFDKMIRNRRK